jgi:hypothetical protein
MRHHAALPCRWLARRQRKFPIPMQLDLLLGESFTFERGVEDASLQREI